jgi:hypothetical protein
MADEDDVKMFFDIAEKILKDFLVCSSLDFPCNRCCVCLGSFSGKDLVSRWCRRRRS